MDFGLDGFVGKFEEHFGRKWSRPLLILVGGAVASLASAAIWNYTLHPLWRLAIKAAPVLSTWSGFVNAAWLAFSIGAGFAAGALLISALRFEALSRRAERVLARAEIAGTEARDLSAMCRQLVAEASNHSTFAVIAVDELLKQGLSKGIFSQEQVDLIRSLQDVESEKQPQLAIATLQEGAT